MIAVPYLIQIKNTKPLNSAVIRLNDHSKPNKPLKYRQFDRSTGGGSSAWTK